MKEEAIRMKEAILVGRFRLIRRFDAHRLGIEEKDGRQHYQRFGSTKVYDAAIAAGALAGKVSGAGGGGFMMFLSIRLAGWT
ncbi:hypothetical protein ACU4GD_15770 [Cupriavidus basilensis]